MSVELIISLASAIIVSLVGAIVFLHRLVIKLEDQLLQQSNDRRVDAENARDKITTMASTWADTAGFMYKREAKRTKR